MLAALDGLDHGRAHGGGRVKAVARGGDQGRGAVKVACIKRPPGGTEARSRGRVLVCRAAGRGEAKSDYLPGKASRIG